MLNMVTVNKIQQSVIIRQMSNIIHIQIPLLMNTIPLLPSARLDRSIFCVWVRQFLLVSLDDTSHTRITSIW